MELGVCYYPEHWPEEMWVKDAKEMKALGLSIVRIGEFAWSKLEPREGEFHFEWLDRAINTLGAAGLKVILGTPSATPPRWVLSKYPDMLAYDIEGRPRKFGSRRHYCFSHHGYKMFAANMAAKFAERYGSDPSLMAWQVDNEYGCHDTIRSYSPVAEQAFQQWLKNKYQSIGNLNERWGNVFWSMEYASFEEIALPNLTVTEANPTHVLDFKRFSSDQVIEWNKAQVNAIRSHSNLPIMHNYMGRITEFDHYKLGDDLEFATWDSYPLGFLEDRSDRSEDFKNTYQNCGDPDFQAFHHDLYRSVGNGRWGVMEQQPGPVNWAPYNPAPSPGVVRTWTLEAMGHGAEFVAYFRWRQAPFAQEQMHSAIKRADNAPAKVYEEIRLLAQELKQENLQISQDNKVALVFDYESQWAWEVQPQGQSFDYFNLVLDYYRTFRLLGIGLDIIRPDSKKMQSYDLLCMPGHFNISGTLMTQLKTYEGQLILGPRTHTKTEDFKLNITSISPLFEKAINIVQVETLRPGAKKKFKEEGEFEIWFEELECDGKPVGAIINEDNKTYVAGWPEKETLIKILGDALNRAGISHERLPDHQRKSGSLVIDYVAGDVSLPMQS